MNSAVPHRSMHAVSCAGILLISAALAGCGGGNDRWHFSPVAVPTPVPASESAPPPATESTPPPPGVPPEPAAPPVTAGKHSVGGTAKGLSDYNPLVLRNNAGDDLKLKADGEFSFLTAVDNGADYAVTVHKQPLWQFCSVKNGTGKASAAVKSVSVTCVDAVAKVTTFAGKQRDKLRGGGPIGPPTEPVVDGPTADATFNEPSSVAVDADGSVYVTDLNSALIRKITAGQVETFAGQVPDMMRNRPLPATDGVGRTAVFLRPIGVALDASRNLYVADQLDNSIRRISPTANVERVAGNGARGAADGRGTGATFDAPAGIAVGRDGRIYVADTGNGQIRIVTSAGDVETVRVPFESPAGLAVDGDRNVYVADLDTHRIHKIVASTGQMETLAGGGEGAVDGLKGAASFRFPVGIAVDAVGHVYVADSGNNLIRKITPAGKVTTLAGGGSAIDGVGKAASFNEPVGIAVDADGTLYVADMYNEIIRKITPVAPE